MAAAMGGPGMGGPGMVGPGLGGPGMGGPVMQVRNPGGPGTVRLTASARQEYDNYMQQRLRQQQQQIGARPPMHTVVEVRSCCVNFCLRCFSVG